MAEKGGFRIGVALSETTDTMNNQSPEFQIFLKVEFDHDVDVTLLTDMLGVEPSHCISYHDAGFTRIDRQKLPAAWWYAYPSNREYLPSWSLQNVMEEFFAKFDDGRLERMKQYVRDGNGSVILTVNGYFFHEQVPELCIYGRPMRCLNKLDADLMINLNEDNSSQ